MLLKGLTWGLVAAPHRAAGTGAVQFFKHFALAILEQAVSRFLSGATGF
jgi:hypothetical protein